MRPEKHSTGKYSSGKNSLCAASLVIMFSAGLANPVSAQIADQPSEVNAILACKNQPSPDARLAWYEAAANQLETAIINGSVLAVSQTDIENVERDAFGFNIPSLPNLGKLFGGKSKTGNPKKSAILTEEGPRTGTSQAASPAAVASLPRPQLKSVNLEIAKVKPFGYKKNRFFLTNGQVWEQVETKDVRIPKVRDGISNTAEISKAALGSFMMRINGEGRAIRVTRVR